jgi:hypothetical protein
MHLATVRPCLGKERLCALWVGVTEARTAQAGLVRRTRVHPLPPRPYAAAVTD